MDELIERIGDPVWLAGVAPDDGWVRIDGVDCIVVRFTRFGDSEHYCFRKTAYGVNVFAYADKQRAGGDPA